MFWPIWVFSKHAPDQVLCKYLHYLIGSMLEKNSNESKRRTLLTYFVWFSLKFIPIYGWNINWCKNAVRSQSVIVFIGVHVCLAVIPFVNVVSSFTASTEFHLWLSTEEQSKTHFRKIIQRLRANNKDTSYNIDSSYITFGVPLEDCPASTENKVAPSRLQNAFLTYMYMYILSFLCTK